MLYTNKYHKNSNRNYHRLTFLETIWGLEASLTGEGWTWLIVDILGGWTLVLLDAP